MFVYVTGTSELVGVVRQVLTQIGARVVGERAQRLAGLTIELQDTEDAQVVFDSVDSSIERELIARVRDLAGVVKIQDEGGNRQTDRVVIQVPKDARQSDAVVRGIARTFAPKRAWWKRWVAIGVVVLALGASPAFAQTTEVSWGQSPEISSTFATEFDGPIVLNVEGRSLVQVQLVGSF